MRRTDGARVFEHEGKPLGGISRVERYVGAPRLEDGQEPHHHRRRTADAEAHQDLGADAQARRRRASRLARALSSA